MKMKKYTIINILIGIIVFTTMILIMNKYKIKKNKIITQQYTSKDMENIYEEEELNMIELGKKCITSFEKYFGENISQEEMNEIKNNGDISITDYQGDEYNIFLQYKTKNFRNFEIVINKKTHEVKEMVYSMNYAIIEKNINTKDYTLPEIFINIHKDEIKEKTNKFIKDKKLVKDINELKFGGIYILSRYYPNIKVFFEYGDNQYIILRVYTNYKEEFIVNGIQYENAKGLQRELYRSLNKYTVKLKNK